MALALLTRLPAGTVPDYAAAARQAGWWLMPVVLLRAAIAAVGAWLAFSILPMELAPVALVALFLLISGALHFDGWVDCADAAFVSDPARRRDVLKDPHTGAIGVAAGALLLLVLAAALSAFGRIDIQLVWRAVAVAAAAGGVAMMLTMRIWRYGGQPGSLGSAFAGSVTSPVAALAVGLGIGAAYIAFGFTGPLYAAAGVVAGLAIAWFLRRRLGAVTGDVYGSVYEAAQATALVVAASMTDKVV